MDATQGCFRHQPPDGMTEYNWNVAYTAAVKSRYNAGTLFILLVVDVPWLARKGGTWGVCCEFIFSPLYVLCNCNAVCKILV